MRTSKQEINSSLKKEIAGTFAQVLADLKTPQEAETFLSDFLNPSELETFIKRLAVAYWLKKERSYTNIKQNLKVSSATIAMIHELLNTPGFKLALKKMEAEEWANVWSEKIRKVIR